MNLYLPTHDKKRQMRNPEAWIGRKVPRNLEYEHFEWDYGKCDDCQCFWWHDEAWNHPGLHEFIYPECEEDWLLQDALHVEECMTFCPECLSQMGIEADQIDPDWRKRHWA